MFYSQFILAKKGPLGTIWIAAHLERKLRKNQVADTDIGVSVDSILFPDVPIALRLSSHLLLGVVRIYSRKVNYLFDDCSEALLKIKQAFRSTAVDLPPEESHAPYHSITLPETFDLDDFELPDNDILQGNYVDHHVSTREQITLQDTMDGVVYSTSQFGLDERFGDGDTSQVALDPEEDLFLDKVEVPGRDEVSEADPQASVKFMAQAESGTSYDGVGSSDAVQVNGTRDKDEYLASPELMDFAQAPSTPGLIEEPNLSSVKKGLASDDHLESDDHNVAEIATERADSMYLSMDNHLNHDIIVSLPAEENGTVSGDPEINRAKVTGPTNENAGEPVDSNESEINKASTCSSEPRMSNVDITDGDCEKSKASFHEAGGEIGNSMEVSDQHGNDVAADAARLLEQPDFPGIDNVEPESTQGLGGPETLKHHVDIEHSASACITGLRPCNSHLNPQDADKSSPSHGLDNNEFQANLQSGDVVPCSSEVSGRDEVALASGSLKKMQGADCHATEGVQLEEDQTLQPVLSGETLADGGKQDEKPDAISNDNQSENVHSSMTSELPAPEKLLSAPQIPVDKPEDLLFEAAPDKEVLEGSDGSSAGTKTSGKKRSFTESSLTVQSMNSIESFGVTKSKRTITSVPDDDDLLSSILVGRKSSVLKLKPTPAQEVISTKRARSASRPSVSKRKVLMDDSMVLLGDTIRQQLTNTEDIRRLRKKAPCTRTEILIIQRQFLEEEIFTEPLLTGVSPELTCLRSETFDLSEIKISENKDNNASSEAVKDKECSTEPVVQHSQMEGSNGNVICRNDINGEDNYLGSFGVGDNGPMDAINNVTDHRPSGHEMLEEVADMEIQSQNVEIGESTKQPVVQEEITGDFCNMPSVLVDDPGLRNETVCGNTSLQMDTSILPSDKMDTQGIDEITSENVNNGEGLDGVGTSSHCMDDIGAAGSNFRSGEEISLGENKPIEVRMDVEVNCLAPNGNVDDSLANDYSEAGNPASMRVDQALEDIEHGMVLGGCDNGDVGVSLECGEGQIPNNVQNEHSNMDCPYSEGVDGDLHRASLNDGDYPVYQEAEHERTMDGEITSFDHVATVHSGDFQDTEFANDTEFLNVDDDEVGEDDEDGMPDDEDARLLENSGWSSRTRAVAKYLQTLFDKEAGHGRKVLPMDNLLAGKTRKEASRMFFETLVLKTRDYIHVEQGIPFDNISLKPRAKLMKSIF
ncbi:hypothetical protein Tsubulata_040033 [Turnera subulata]|uniref:Rad21/Rec8-like protein N-terminal domain-containing protein n=1 Tax=Turnera subulata TaxID=218843 RepID=A0A9Q0JE17_9ROSI|nr:hypothetical protein Tsubulata_040033 [Turnera subulata]